jgi:uncharacterized protein (TIGR00661 family)
MKIIFGTCVSGNGHQTQAIAVKQFLEKQGDTTVVCNLVGKPFKNKLSKYFTDEFNIIQHDGFDFVFDKKGRVIIWKTMLKNVCRLPILILSFIKICCIIRKEKPDVIFNYYEPLVGLTALFFYDVKYVSFGHQYAMESPVYPKIPGYAVQKLFLKIINKITSIRSKKIALSYYEFNDDNMIVCPPILRRESYTLSEKQEDFILVYLMNEGMLPQLLEEAKKHSHIKFECFTKLTTQHDTPSNIKLYNLDGKLFQEKMKVCRAVICSGGFETSAEAVYQFKPLLMIPMPNHYEQHANCNDAYLQSMAVYSEKINCSKIPIYQIGNKKWFDDCETQLNKVLNYLKNS